MNKLTFFLVVILTVLAFTEQPLAQTEDPAFKQKLILELIELTFAGFDPQKEFERGMAEQKEMISNEFFGRPLNDENFSEVDRESYQKRMRESMERMFDKITEKVNQEVDFGGFTKAFLARFYYTHYTESEIKELIAFYKTPLGKKTLETSIMLASDLMKDYKTEIEPKILKISREIADEEMKRILPLIQNELDMDDEDGASR